MSDFRPQGSSIIPRGLGRSYGDATLNSAGHVLLTERLNRFLAFDPDTGILRAEAGVTLEDVLDVFVPRGWFPPVLPGTKFVTLGGAVAADIHGKNHHCDGTFGQHVVSLALVLADGSTVKCSPKEQPELFWATVGGMGLTGLIAEVSIRLRPVHSAYMEVQHTPAGDLETAMRLLESDRPEAPYTVAWIDCLASGKQLGRSVVMTGAHTHGAAALHHSPDPFDPKTGRRWSVPCNFPSWTLNPLTIKAFNSL
ncbi:MAG: FAD-binding oxidoreductase, partial [Chlamydiia bacterium]|nr:FAD-binding oxidoreductase [Chlamydiia bacterium]